MGVSRPNHTATDAKRNTDTDPDVVVDQILGFASVPSRRCSLSLTLPESAAPLLHDQRSNLHSGVLHSSRTL